MRVALLLVLGLLAVPALAQEGGLPVNIEADMLEFQQDKGLYIAKGNAVVEQDGITIRADQLTASGARDGQSFTRVQADGNVRISGKNGDITGERGVYDLVREVAVLKGNNLRLTTPTDEVTATESLEFWQKDNLAVARGQALARRGDNRISADVLTAALARNDQQQMEIRRVGAQGNVLVSTPHEIARGERGVYDVRRQLATLEGNVRITRGENQLNGGKAEINMATGVSRLLAGGGQRVRGLILPKNAPELQ
jgi:lipopolysaccharide export system protein LptA